MLNRLKGLADGIGLDIDSVLRARIHISEILMDSLGACTVIAAAPPATTGGIYAAWNMDIFYLLKLLPIGGWLPLFTVVNPPDGYRYITMGIPVLAGIGLLNERGLSCVVNAVPAGDGGDGLLHIDLISMAMESCATAKDAAELIRDQERFCPGPDVSPVISQFLCLNIQFVDGDGGIAAVEYSHNHFAVSYGENGISAQTNIHQFLDPALTGCPTPAEDCAMTGTTMRLYRAWDLLREKHGNIDLEAVKEIMRDREFAPLPEDVDPYRYSEARRYQQSISRAGWKTLPITVSDLLSRDIAIKDFLEKVLMMSGTCFSLIIEPDQKIIHWSMGRPDILPYFSVYCADLLGVEGVQGMNLLTAYVHVLSALGKLIYIVPMGTGIMTMLHDVLIRLLKWLGS